MSTRIARLFSIRIFVISPSSIELKTEKNLAFDPVANAEALAISERAPRRRRQFRRAPSPARRQISGWRALRREVHGRSDRDIRPVSVPTSRPCCTGVLVHEVAEGPARQRTSLVTPTYCREKYRSCLAPRDRWNAKRERMRDVSGQTRGPSDRFCTRGSDGVGILCVAETRDQHEVAVGQIGGDEFPDPTGKLFRSQFETGSAIVGARQR